MKNWKTTLTGVVGAAALCVFQLISTGTLDPKTLIIAAVLAAIGSFAKDHDVTGNQFLQASIPLADAILDDIAKTNHTQIIGQIHSMIDGVEVQQPASSIPGSPTVTATIKN